MLQLRHGTVPGAGVSSSPGCASGVWSEQKRAASHLHPAVSTRFAVTGRNQGSKTPVLSQNVHTQTATVGAWVAAF